MITPITLTNSSARAIPRTFIHCVEGLSADEIKSEEKRFNDSGWSYRFIPTGHDVMITMPEALAEMLIELINPDPVGYRNSQSLFSK